MNSSGSRSSDSTPSTRMPNTIMVMVTRFSTARRTIGFTRAPGVADATGAADAAGAAGRLSIGSTCSLMSIELAAHLARSPRTRRSRRPEASAPGARSLLRCFLGLLTRLEATDVLGLVRVDLRHQRVEAELLARVEHRAQVAAE